MRQWLGGRLPTRANAADLGRWLVRAALEPASADIKRATPTPRKNYRRAYSIALVGVGALTGLALLNNRQALATAMLIAVGLGAAFVAGSVHRSGL
ncbi:hypothetical protein, partial [Fodinicola feengrottensis]